MAHYCEMSQETAQLPETMSALDLASHLKVPLATLYGWRHKGVGPPSHKVGRHLRYVQEEVEEWVKQQ